MNLYFTPSQVFEKSIEVLKQQKTIYHSITYIVDSIYLSAEHKHHTAITKWLQIADMINEIEVYLNISDRHADISAELDTLNSSHFTHLVTYPGFGQQKEDC